MAVYLRPKRAKKATATSQAIVLKRGEIFFEVPTGGVGTGIGKIKMGDGSTTYSSLPYFTSTEDDKVAFTNVTASTAISNNATYLTNISPSNNLKTLLNNIKQLLFNLNSQVNNWTSSQTLAAGATSVSFSGLTSTYAYDLYAETADGTPVYVTGSSSSGTTITYNLKAITSAQAGTAGTGCKVKLKCLY